MLTFCYLMPFFRVFRVFRAWLWAKGLRRHTVHTAGSWARDTRCTRYRGERRQCVYVGCVVCRTSWARMAGRTSRTSRTSEAGRTSRTSGTGRTSEAGRTGRTSGVRMVHCSICLFFAVRFTNTSCVKRTLLHACKDASPRCARPAGYSRKMSICYLIRCNIVRKTRKKRLFALFVV